MRIAVIGSGPSAAATCLGLTSLNKNYIEIDVIDIGRKLGSDINLLNSPPSYWSHNSYQNIHDQIKEKTKGWIPEKTYSGSFPSLYEGTHIYNSDNFGGLSKFWGASFLPFANEDFVNWPINLEELRPYYHNILKNISITGESDPIGKYFSTEFFNDNSINVPEEFNRLKEFVNTKTTFLAGSPRLALANSGKKACTYCGHCFYGCYNDSIYTSDQTMNKLIDEHKINYINDLQAIRYRVTSSGLIELTVINVKTQIIETLTYDSIYIAAGTIESTRIFSNSNGLDDELFPIIENPMYFVPMIYSGKSSRDSFNKIVALNNLLIGRLPDQNIVQYVHMQLYPLNLYLWNHGLSKVMGSLGYRLSRMAQQIGGHRIYMILFYLHGDLSRMSSIKFNGNQTEINFKYDDSAWGLANYAINDLKQQLHGSRFHVLSKFMGPIGLGGSNHYAGTLPMGSNKFGLEKNCSVNRNVYITDSSTFPSLPTQNHSFTIMANAYRVAEQSLS